MRNVGGDCSFRDGHRGHISGRSTYRGLVMEEQFSEMSGGTRALLPIEHHEVPENASLSFLFRCHAEAREVLLRDRYDHRFDHRQNKLAQSRPDLLPVPHLITRITLAPVARVEARQRRRLVRGPVWQNATAARWAGPLLGRSATRRADSFCGRERFCQIRNLSLRGLDSKSQAPRQSWTAPEMQAVLCRSR